MIGVAVIDRIPPSSPALSSECNIRTHKKVEALNKPEVGGRVSEENFSRESFFGRPSEGLRLGPLCLCLYLSEHWDIILTPMVCFALPCLALLSILLLITYVRLPRVRGGDEVHTCNNKLS